MAELTYEGFKETKSAVLEKNAESKLLQSASNSRSLFGDLEMFSSARQMDFLIEASGISPSDEDYDLRVNAILQRYIELDPQDEFERMLAQQMIITHECAFRAFARAGSNELENPEMADMFLRQGDKLMSLYLKQLSAFNKYRGKGQQKVTVEHVTVQTGGQAVVGNIDARLSKDANESLEDKQVISVDLTAKKSKANM